MLNLLGHETLGVGASRFLRNIFRFERLYAVSCETIGFNQPSRLREWPETHTLTRYMV